VGKGPGPTVLHSGSSGAQAHPVFSLVHPGARKEQREFHKKTKIQPWGTGSGPDKGKGEGKALTRRCYHALPLLEKAGLEAVAGAEAIGFVAGHKLLHGLEYHTELGADHRRWLVRGDTRS
jgi:hypothetical protein